MAEGGYDFDPLTEEGRADINQEIDEHFDEFEDSYFKDPSGRSLSERFRKFGTGIKYAFDRFRSKFNQKNSGQKIPEYLQLDNMDEIEGDKNLAIILSNEIKKLYPEFDETDYKNVIKYFKLNSNGEIEMFDPLNKQWKLLGPDERKIPLILKNKLGWSREHINRYNQAKKKLDNWYESNTLTRENGYDLNDEDGIFYIKDGSRDWKPLHTKRGYFYSDQYKGVPRLSRQIRDRLGSSNYENREDAENKIQDLQKRIKDRNERISAFDADLQEKEDRTIILTRKKTAFVEEQSNKGLTQEEIIAEEEYQEYDRMQKASEEQYRQGQEARQKLLQENIQDQEEVDNQEEEVERINERLPLRERIKQIIKRYGVTVIGIGLCVGTIIGVIINSLRSGLTKLGNTTANALKVIGKKLGQILPGMIGSIASFIFRTASEVVGFLAKNSWLLIVAVVMYMVQRYKNKN